MVTRTITAPCKSSHKATHRLLRMFLTGVFALVSLLTICAALEGSGRALEKAAEESSEAPKKVPARKSELNCPTHEVPLILNRKRKGRTDKQCKEILYCSTHGTEQGLCQEKYGIVYYKCPVPECDVTDKLGQCHRARHDEGPCIHPSSSENSPEDVPEEAEVLEETEVEEAEVTGENDIPKEEAIPEEAGAPGEKDNPEEKEDRNVKKPRLDRQ